MRCEAGIGVGVVSSVGCCRVVVAARIVVWCGNGDVVVVARQIVGMVVEWCGASKVGWGLCEWAAARLVEVVDRKGWMKGEVVVDACLSEAVLFLLAY